jgi:hypothetical protein
MKNKLFPLLIFPLCSYALEITEINPRSGAYVSVNKDLRVSINVGRSGFSVEKAWVEINGVRWQMSYDYVTLVWTTTVPAYGVGSLGPLTLDYGAVDYGGFTAYRSIDVEVKDNPILEQPVIEEQNETVDFYLANSPYAGGEINTATQSPILDSEVTLTAHAQPGFEFSYWSGDVNSTENPLVIFADRPKTIIANYSGDLRDSDEDGLLNYEELHIHGTSIYQKDTDNDGLTDFQEVENGWNPLLSDRETVDAVMKMKSVTGSSPYTNDWFYIPDLGWMWTDQETYPFFFNSSSSTWYYFQYGNTKPRFFDYKKNQWFDL